MIYAGIDYSMTCPAITICTGHKPTVDNCHFFFYNNKTKLAKDFGNKVHGFLSPSYESQEERFDNISEWALKILKAFDVKECCIEDYAMGAKGKIFHIGENGGVLKHKLYKNGIKYINVAPTSAKKFFTGKGNAKKEDMYDAFIQRTEYNLEEVTGCKAKDNPISDIVDSYAMCCYGMENIEEK